MLAGSIFLSIDGHSLRINSSGGRISIKINSLLTLWYLATKFSYNFPLNSSMPDSLKQMLSRFGELQTVVEIWGFGVWKKSYACG